MRVVLDTNTVISGLLWPGNPRRILDLARSGEITLCVSQALLVELLDVLSRPKFVARLALIGATPVEVVDGYATLAEAVEVTMVEPLVLADPDDDEVLACALAANASYVVSGDRHLLDVDSHEYIRIMSAAQFLGLLTEGLE
jgi:putative PIN family toxin of toxin-antitoxin system